MATFSKTKELYERYPYPPPSTDFREDERKGSYVEGEPRLYGPVIWPDGRPEGQLRVLSAGCGTDLAAWLAYRDRSCDVVGVDISTASLQIEKSHREKYALKNLQLHVLDLNNIKSLGQFDLIYCTGVLHHLEDPVAGLKSLASALKPGAKMVLMVYGSALRSGIYLLQDAFRRLNLKQKKQDITLARNIFNLVPDFHMAKQYAKLTPEISNDAAFADTFLHPQDRAYSVPELMELIKSAGLIFQTWTNVGHYHPHNFFGADAQIMERLRSVDEIELWTLIEQLTSALGTHTFVVTNDVDLRPISRQVMSGDWLDLVPTRHFDLKVLTKPSPSVRMIDLSRGRMRFNLTPQAMAAVELIDGHRTARDICADPRFQGTDVDTVRSFVGNILRELYFRGHIFLSRAPSVSR